MTSSNASSASSDRVTRLGEQSRVVAGPSRHGQRRRDRSVPRSPRRGSLRRTSDSDVNQVISRLGSVLAELQRRDDALRARETGARHCVICLSDIVRGERVVTLPCMHVFHAECMLPYLRTAQAPACPEDRLLVSPGEVDGLPVWYWGEIAVSPSVDSPYAGFLDSDLWAELHDVCEAFRVHLVRDREVRLVLLVDRLLGLLSSREQHSSSRRARSSSANTAPTSARRRSSG